VADEIRERIVLSSEAFAALLKRLAEPPRYCPKIARVMMRRTPWDEYCEASLDLSNQDDLGEAQ
jgi:uncharacterized protein (DUF1778 family)